MKPSYSSSFIEQALSKVLSRNGRSISQIAQELNVNHHTLRYWMKKKSEAVSAVPAPEKRPHDWSAREQLLALQESYGLSGEALQAWCRERGIFPHHLTSWEAAFCGDRSSAAAPQELRNLKQENAQLRREATRKDKALAEAAALLVLQKKFRALWEDEEN